MISMGDRDQKGGVNQADFMFLMEELGLIPKEKKKLADAAARAQEANQDAWAAEEKRLVEQARRDEMATSGQALLDKPAHGQPVNA